MSVSVAERLQQMALRRFTGYHRGAERAAFQHARARIQYQTAHRRLQLRRVASVTLVRQNGPDLRLEEGVIRSLGENESAR